MMQSGLRRHGAQARRQLTAEYRSLASRRIAERFLSSRYFLSARTLACYISVGAEVDTTAIIERAWCANKRIFVPVTEPGRLLSFRLLEPDTQLVRNDFGLWEPEPGETIAAANIDVVATPLVAFDDQRHRIGMGGGYFDSTFAFLGRRRHWCRPKLIGLAFDCQRVEKIQPNPWDIRLYRVFTEAR